MQMQRSISHPDRRQIAKRAGRLANFFALGIYISFPASLAIAALMFAAIVGTAMVAIGGILRDSLWIAVGNVINAGMLHFPVDRLAVSFVLMFVVVAIVGEDEAIFEKDLADIRQLTGHYHYLNENLLHSIRRKRELLESKDKLEISAAKRWLYIANYLGLPAMVEPLEAVWKQEREAETQRRMQFEQRYSTWYGSDDQLELMRQLFPDAELSRQQDQYVPAPFTPNQRGWYLLRRLAVYCLYGFGALTIISSCQSAFHPNVIVWVKVNMHELLVNTIHNPLNTIAVAVGIMALAGFVIEDVKRDLWIWQHTNWYRTRSAEYDEWDYDSHGWRKTVLLIASAGLLLVFAAIIRGAYQEWNDNWRYKG